jgi:hypothetical protein
VINAALAEADTLYDLGLLDTDVRDGSAFDNILIQ